jgi:hypothetical protein
VIGMAELSTSRAWPLWARLTQMYLGLALYGLAIALEVRARLGLDPWDVFHQGLARVLGISIGTCVIAVGVVVLLLWIPLRERPGLGTISNVIVIGLAIDVALGYLPVPNGMTLRLVTLVGGILICGIATGAYIGAGFGPGRPDDGDREAWPLDPGEPDRDRGVGARGGLPPRWTRRPWYRPLRCLHRADRSRDDSVLPSNGLDVTRGDVEITNDRPRIDREFVYAYL